MKHLGEALRANRYPGRLVVLCRTHDDVLTAAYALTGRSEASRARRMEGSAAGELAVVPVGAQDNDALRHYVAACVAGPWTVYGNGEQVAEVAARLTGGQSPAEALHGLEYEPDPPIFTPRITVVVERADGKAWLGAARRPGNGRESTDTTVTALGRLPIGHGVLLSTYESDGQQVATARHHLDVLVDAGDAGQLLDEVWQALDPGFLVAATAFAPQDGVEGEVRHAADVTGG
ncbi:IMP cyclohydrolase [Streptomyces sp. NPDC058369]|uniref:IMP cyclohydrolase n=1 Tax=Streptomyces sp. NPDC058369 TaxID=3346462 RepID=UPI003665B1F8